MSAVMGCPYATGITAAGQCQAVPHEGGWRSTHADNVTPPTPVNISLLRQKALSMNGNMAVNNDVTMAALGIMNTLA